MRNKLLLLAICTTVLAFSSFSFAMENDGETKEYIFSGEITDYSKNDYLPARDTSTRYYAENFWLEGIYKDEEKKIYSLEYSTGEDWYEIEDFNKNENGEILYRIELDDGVYDYIALRTIDEEGNTSSPLYLRDENENTFRVVVDKQEPILDVSIKTGDSYYFGEWTNEEISINIQCDKSCYADFYKLEYCFLEEGEIFTDESQWYDCSNEIIINENINGFYLFRGISKTGKESISDGKTRYRIRYQKNIDAVPTLVETASEIEKKNQWYNLESGVPTVDFAVTNIDINQAPVTLFAKWTRNNHIYRYDKYSFNRNISSVDEIDLSDFSMDFEIDGIYEVEYWLEDKAYNETVHEKKQYYVDREAPAVNAVWINGNKLSFKDDRLFYYEQFINNQAEGKIDFGNETSPIKKLEVCYQENGTDISRIIPIQNNVFYLEPGIKGNIKISAIDEAGNYSETYTQGIVIENEVPLVECNDIKKYENKGGFINENFTFDVTCSDYPDNKYSALKEVVITAKSEAGIITEDKIINNLERGFIEGQLQKNKTIEKHIKYNAKELEGNDVEIIVTALDLCGNKTSKIQRTNIDVTNPILEIVTPDKEDDRVYYNDDYRVIFRVYDKNFSGEADISLVCNGIERKINSLDWKHFNDTHEAQILLENDGKYSIQGCVYDLAGNKSNTVSFNNLIIDKTKPNVSILDKNQEHFQNYYNKQRNIILQIEEENFDENEIVIDIKGGMYEKSLWKNEGKLHSCSIAFMEDGFYTYNIYCKDIAGNISEKKTQEFYIDRSIPNIKIIGLENNTANKGKVYPRIIVQDDNYDVNDIEIYIRDGQNKTKEIIPSMLQKEGLVYYLSDINSYEDGIYYLLVKVKDLAGNINQIEYRFSLNRTGSSYDISKNNDLINQRYINSKYLKDILITEFNLDRIDDTKIFIYQNGKIKTTKDVDYTKKESGDSNSGYIYDIAISKNNFKKEGLYRIVVYSKDIVGNEVNSMAAGNKAEVSFVVDNTSPYVMIEEKASNLEIDKDKKHYEAIIRDNIGLEKADIFLMDENKNILQKWDYLELSKIEGDCVDITLPKSNGMTYLCYDVMDFAGNGESTYKEFTDTTALERKNARVIQGIALLILALMLTVIFLLVKGYLEIGQLHRVVMKPKKCYHSHKLSN